MPEEELNQQEEQQQEGEQQQAPQVDPEVENRALKMGWVPKERFRGDPERWQPATEFVRRADELMPIMKTQLRKYEDRIDQLTGEIQGQRKTMEKIVKMSETVGQRAYEQAKADLTKRQVEAVAAGDTKTWMELEQEKDKLERPEKIEVQEPANKPNADSPQFREWHSENDWYLSDEDMTIYANAYIQGKPELRNLPYKDYLDTVTNAVKRAFPHKFSNPNRSKAAAVDAGAQRGASPGRPKAKTYNDLPPDAKVQCDKYMAQGLFKTREDYAKEYFSEE